MMKNPHAAPDDGPAQLPPLVLPATWATHFDTAQAGWLEPLRRLLPPLLPRFLARQRWFAAKGKAVEHLAIVGQLLWQNRWLLLQIEVALRGEPAQDYWLPLSIAWTRSDPGGADAATVDSADIVARLRCGENDGILYDALADAAFCHALLAATSRGERLEGPGGILAFTPGSAFARLAGDDFSSLPVRRAGATSSNTAVLFGQRLFLKAYRRLATGPHPEVEMARFLTDVSPYAHIAPLAGALEYRRRDGGVCALAMLQGFVASDGDAWSHTQDALRALLAAAPHAGAEREARQAADERRWATLGRRTGEMHRALARTTGDPDFDPEPVRAADLEQWIRQIDGEARHTLEELARRLADLPAALHERAQILLAARAALLARINGAAPQAINARITRYHGDFHLGQVLVVGDDFILIDFEGEPSRPLAERRRKHSPLRDVAGMLRSLNYAACSALGEARSAGAADAGGAPLEAVLADWEARASAAFLAGYRDALHGSPAAADAPTSRFLLDLFLIEKALYELRYELNHRPDWVHVPLGGLLGLLRAMEG